MLPPVPQRLQLGRLERHVHRRLAPLLVPAPQPRVQGGRPRGEPVNTVSAEGGVKDQLSNLCPPARRHRHVERADDETRVGRSDGRDGDGLRVEGLRREQLAHHDAREGEADADDGGHEGEVPLDRLVREREEELLVACVELEAALLPLGDRRERRVDLDAQERARAWLEQQQRHRPSRGSEGGGAARRGLLRAGRRAQRAPALQAGPEDDGAVQRRRRSAVLVADVVEHHADGGGAEAAEEAAAEGDGDGRRVDELQVAHARGAEAEPLEVDRPSHPRVGQLLRLPLRRGGRVEREEDGVWLGGVDQVAQPPLRHHERHADGRHVCDEQQRGGVVCGGGVRRKDERERVLERPPRLHNDVLLQLFDAEGRVGDLGVLQPNRAGEGVGEGEDALVAPAREEHGGLPLLAVRRADGGRVKGGAEGAEVCGTGDGYVERTTRASAGCIGGDGDGADKVALAAGNALDRGDGARYGRVQDPPHPAVVREEELGALRALLELDEDL
mmetsp:Transcript_46363/g.153685  ORF Transcript_46363/g.153685 Transcript_46363/m.153685 type:complete len:502 (-) Transcript_46363:918-2423(-)